MNKTIKVIATDGETLLDGAWPEEQYVIELSDIADYDAYEQAIQDLLGLDLPGPTMARLMLLLSKNFLQAHGEKFELSSEELREQD